MTVEPFPCVWCGQMLVPGELSPENPHACPPGTFDRIRTLPTVEPMPTVELVTEEPRLTVHIDAAAVLGHCASRENAVDYIAKVVAIMRGES